MLLLVVGSARVAFAQETVAPKDSTVESSYFTVSGGWSWPVGGPVEESYEPGFTVGAAFRKGMKGNYMGGIEFGYTWLTLDSAKLAEANPGSTFSGDIAFEHHYRKRLHLRRPGKPMRP
jgi:hypothetical protein